MNEKVEAFPTPKFLSVGDSAGTMPDVSVIFPLIFTVIFFIWVVYTLVVAYHWFRYGHRSFLTVPLLALHIVVSGTLMVLALAGLN